MAKPSPLQIVKEKFGSKDKLVEVLTDLLEADEDESAEDFSERLKRVANAKLLHLHAVGTKVKELGGRDALVTTVAEQRGQANDKDFVAKLKTRSLSSLLAELVAGERRVKKTTKAAAADPT